MARRAEVEQAHSRGDGVERSQGDDVKLFKQVHLGPVGLCLALWLSRALDALAQQQGLWASNEFGKDPENAP